jgi:hypothetical protein
MRAAVPELAPELELGVWTCFPTEGCGICDTPRNAKGYKNVTEAASCHSEEPANAPARTTRSGVGKCESHSGCSAGTSGCFAAKPP